MFFSITRTIFFGVGQNNFGNKIPFICINLGPMHCVTNWWHNFKMHAFLTFHRLHLIGLVQILEAGPRMSWIDIPLLNNTVYTYANFTISVSIFAVFNNVIFLFWTWGNLHYIWVDWISFNLRKSLCDAFFFQIPKSSYMFHNLYLIVCFFNFSGCIWLVRSQCW